MIKYVVAQFSSDGNKVTMLPLFYDTNRKLCDIYRSNCLRLHPEMIPQNVQVIQYVV